MARNRVGAYIGTILVLMVVAALLLAARDLWAVQANAIGAVLDAAGVTHEVVTSPDRLDLIELGERSRDGEVRRAHAPLIGVPAPPARRATSEAAAALSVFAVAACGALALARKVPGPVKGFVGVALAIAVGSVVYGTWVSPLPPLDVSELVVDWRTSALAPAAGLALIYAYDLYPLPGSFVLKTFWLMAGLTAVAVFSTFRLAMVAAAYETFGAPSFLAAFHVAGTFWDLLPGIGVLALAHGTLAASIRSGRRPFFLP